jgi:hypothetical protein
MKMIPIQNYEGLYSLTEDGRVYSHMTHMFISSHIPFRVLKGKGKVDWYPVVMLRRPKRRFLLHRLLAEHFIPNPNNYPQVNHIDGDKTNFSLDNLEWCTAQQNVRHAYATGLANRVRDPYPKGPDHPLYKPEIPVKSEQKRGDNHKSTKIPDAVIQQIVDLAKDTHSNKKIAEALGVRVTLVGQVLTGVGRGKGVFESDILKLRAEGLSDRDIRFKLGCSYKLIERTI